MIKGLYEACSDKCLGHDFSTTTPEEAAAIRQGYTAYTPMLRLADPDELAVAALFLASGESSFMTGSDMVVDGGVSNV